MIIIFLYNYSYSQNIVKGKIIDSKTKKSLAFVNIIFNNKPYLGTTTDIDGKFFFKSSQKLKNLTCSYVGYERFTIVFDTIEKKCEKINIELHPSAYKLKEVIVKAGENPANRIIKKLIENKDINNPENISSFKYHSYNKVIYDFELNDTIDTDSIKIKIDSMLKGGHMLIMESVTERKYIKPDKNEEIILGTKVSGFKHPSFASLATDIQPFSFYKDMITVLDINYLNPISNGSLKKYHFNIEDTLFHNKDTIYIISFKPLPNKILKLLQEFSTLIQINMLFKMLLLNLSKKVLLILKYSNNMNILITNNGFLFS
ncbi:MAG: carboxypeptidase-like regulatory domain-containing protein [Bacteroidales bacterium]|nr:carboxypeptidase-like regulatory domain-containing protein [Bacteroidales bacterium]